MKQIYNILFGICLVSLVACQEADVLQETVCVTFTAQLEEIQPSMNAQGKRLKSAQASEPLAVNRLIVGVFNNQLHELMRDTVAVESTTIDVTLQLVKNHTYHIIFWADCEAAAYDINDLTSITQTVFPTTFADAEKMDAFVAVKKDFTASQLSQAIQLKRPLAQVNIGTTKEARKTTLTLKQAATVYHPFTHTISGKRDITWAFTTAPTETFTMEEVTYNYLMMGYVFATTHVQSVETSLEIADAPVDLPLLTLQANCRTNVGVNF